MRRAGSRAQPEGSKCAELKVRRAHVLLVLATVSDLRSILVPATVSNLLSILILAIVSDLMSILVLATVSDLRSYRIELG